MDTTLWIQVRLVFDEAILIPTSERSAWLAQKCHDMPAVCKEVDLLLRSHDTLGRFLEPPEEPARQAGESTLSGKQIGPYRIERVIGEGGMGAVYKAVRDYGNYQKSVAIKVVRGAMWNESILVRFEHERETLARLQHPNIAQLLDCGTTDDGLPYVVMEYVEGIPLDEYCDGRKLNVVERLGLFRTICTAVHYAHQNLIVHLDLKPGNILVDAAGTPKLLDFGIAKMVDTTQHVEASEMTRAGLRFITPEYASPELLRNEVVTTKSDIYSLGVMLFKLLTGKHPYNFRNRLPHEISRVVCEEPPQKPSTIVLRKAHQGETKGRNEPEPEEMSALRDATPQKLSRQLSGDLDNIILKTLEKSHERRYGSVENLSEDIGRHLAGLPVFARNAGVTYRVAKFVRRHKVGAASAAAVVLLLVGGAIAILWQARRATKEAAKAEQINSFLQEMLASSDPSRSGKDVTVVQTLDRAVENVDRKLSNQPEIAAAVLHTIGESYVALGEYDKAAVEFERALQIQLKVFGSKHEEISTSLHSMAYVAQVERNFPRADSLYRLAIAMHKEVHPAPDQHLAGMVGDYGSLLVDRQDMGKALPLLRESVEITREVFGKGTLEYATALTNLGPALQKNHDLAEAESVLREALDIRRRLTGKDDYDVGFALNNLAFVLADKGDYGGAEVMFREALAIWRKSLGNDHPQVATGLMNLAGVVQKRGDLDDAGSLLQEALALLRKQEPPDPLRLSSVEHLLGRNMIRRNNPVQAEAYLRDALSLRKELFPPGHLVVAIVESDLGRSLMMLKRYPEAEWVLVDAYNSLALSFGDTSARARETRGFLKELYVAWGKKEPELR